MARVWWVRRIWDGSGVVKNVDGDECHAGEKMDEAGAWNQSWAAL